MRFFFSANPTPRGLPKASLAAGTKPLEARAVATRSSFAHGDAPCETESRLGSTLVAHARAAKTNIDGNRPAHRPDGADQNRRGLRRGRELLVVKDSATGRTGQSCGPSRISPVKRAAL